MQMPTHTFRVTKRKSAELIAAVCTSIKQDHYQTPLAHLAADGNITPVSSVMCMILIQFEKVHCSARTFHILGFLKPTFLIFLCRLYVPFNIDWVGCSTAVVPRGREGNRNRLMTRQGATYAGVTSLYVRCLTRGTNTNLLFMDSC